MFVRKLGDEGCTQQPRQDRSQVVAAVESILEVRQIAEYWAKLEVEAVIRAADDRIGCIEEPYGPSSYSNPFPSIRSLIGWLPN
jgi:hypothetical protein